MADKQTSTAALQLPASYEWYREQIAGHHPSVVKNGEHQIGLIKEIGSETLLKPVQEGVRGVCEVAFYNNLKHQNDDGDVLTKFSIFVPKFYGLKTLRIGGKEVEFIVMEDLTHRYKCPCIMDIKMGRVTYDPSATKAKRLSEAVKYPEQETLGFRLTGYRMRFGCNENDLRVRDKQWGRSRNLGNIVDAFREFLSGRFMEKSFVVEQTLEQLYMLRKWFNSQRIYHFYASSILLGYEACVEQPPNVLVKLIDFSHVFPANGAVDDNYLFGLNSVINIIEKYRDSVWKLVSVESKGQEDGGMSAVLNSWK
uniref:Kinase n=1 Tax=Loa loa TaxID=7209 RepID=A0A1I7VJ03_LOALO